MPVIKYFKRTPMERLGELHLEVDLPADTIPEVWNAALEQFRDMMERFEREAQLIAGGGRSGTANRTYDFADEKKENGS